MEKIKNLISSFKKYILVLVLAIILVFVYFYMFKKEDEVILVDEKESFEVSETSIEENINKILNLI